MSKLMTCAHNVVRANVAPKPGQPLPDLKWSADLASLARAHAQACKFAHSQRFDVGENLAVFSDVNTDPLTVVKVWAAEAQNFNYETNRCKQGEVCGHYTQVVWRNTTHVGCGVAQCPHIEGFPYAGALWVCNYSPAGNVLGQEPY